MLMLLIIVKAVDHWRKQLTVPILRNWRTLCEHVLN